MRDLLVAALCVARISVYKSLDGVDCYDIERDARTFAGGMPIVAHPPCRAWSAHCAHQAKAPQAEIDLAPWCIDQLKHWGGVLEHPANSRLWEYCALPGPGETRGDLHCMEVLQAWWGDSRPKRTWLLLSQCQPQEIPFRLFDVRNHRNQWNTMSRNRRAETPIEFAEWLVATARGVYLR